MILCKEESSGGCGEICRLLILEKAYTISHPRNPRPA